MTDLSPDQEHAADAVERFIRALSHERRYFVLHGLAGTGKTYLWSHLAQKYRGAVLVTPTGKAASVLRKRSMLDVKTIHSVIYNFKGLVDDREVAHKKNPVFTDKEDLDLGGHLVFLDECSMVGRRLAEDLLQTGALVVACGDPGQLPPVNDAPFFTDADATLTEIHRQALESPIVRQAHAVRHTGRYEADGDGFRIVQFAEPSTLLGADILLCWTNLTRRRLNAKKRRLLDHSGPLKKGEPIMCLKTNYVSNVFNGQVLWMDRDRDPANPNLWIRDDDGRTVFVARATIEGEHAFEVQRYKEDVTPFAAAYASTVHKAQGSEYPSVLLLDERPRGPERTPFLYTGITRAVEKCTVVAWR